MIYIHVPFCRSFCTYCGFYSETCIGEGGAMDRYADALCREIESRKEELRNHSANGRNTLYIGGGTPSVLPLSVLEHIVDTLIIAVNGGPGDPLFEEFTVEVNPDDIVKRGVEYARGLRKLGVTRVSMGVQSFDAKVLRWMNRRHGPEDAETAFRILREAGFDNISIDLIFGFGNVSGGDTWADSVARAIALAPEHISAYQLSIEPDSALEKMLADGRFEEADEELCRGQYELLCHELADAGYVHYEVSNFALPGREARHNSGYWDHSPYVGLGPAAHSFDGCRRKWNVADVDAYVDGAPMEGEDLSAEQKAIEDIMLGLRTAAGVSGDHLRQLADPLALGRLIASGSLVEEEGMVRIPESGFFVSDDIIRELL